MAASVKRVPVRQGGELEDDFVPDADAGLPVVDADPGNTERGFREACYDAGFRVTDVRLPAYSGPAVVCQRKRDVFDVGRAYPGRLTFEPRGAGYIVFPG